MKLAMAQMAMSGDMAKNLEKSLAFCREASGSDLLFFPEIQLTPFFPQYKAADTPYPVKEYCLTEDSDYVLEFCEAARTEGLFISPNVYLQRDGKPFDASLWITPDGEINGVATMVHVLQAQNFYERDYYTPSTDGFHVFDTPWGKVGIVICFDRHLPESIRTCASKGAQLIIIPTANIEGEPLEMFEWELRVQAMHSNVFIAMCNRVGTEGDATFAGQSIVVDPDGEVILKADNQEQLITCEIDLEQTKESRAKRPYITLRRPSMYE